MRREIKCRCKLCVRSGGGVNCRILVEVCHGEVARLELDSIDWISLDVVIELLEGGDCCMSIPGLGFLPLLLACRSHVNQHLLPSIFFWSVLQHNAYTVASSIGLQFSNFKFKLTVLVPFVY